MRNICDAFWTWRDGVCQDFLIEKAKKLSTCKCIFSSTHLPSYGFIWWDVELSVSTGATMD
jgi:hypothetical protein